MVYWLWALVCILVCVVVWLSFRLALMCRAAEEIREKFAERLETETNTLIDISSRDKHMRSLAADINRQLKKLRAHRRRFQQGNLELKEAVANMSHDLRTPLTAISGYLELLEGEEKSEAAARYLSQIKNRMEVLRQLTEELFRYSIITSTEAEERERVDLRQALEESLLSFYGVMRQRGIDPDIDMTKERVERCLNVTAVHRIFNNVLGNALKYTDGDLRVRMDDNGVIRFSNTARALDPVTVGRLFDRFYTVQTGRNSTGLGLAIAKQLTEQMGGRITAEYRSQSLEISLYFPPDQTGDRQ